jgi:hypothetical protein
MKIRHFLLYILVTVSLLNSCAPTVEPPADFGYNYIPIDTGRYYIYDVDSIRINLTATPYQNDTFHYQVKEFYPYTFIDGLGETATCCTRYYRTDTTQPWAITSGTNVWWLKRTTTRLEKTEENLTYVKMTYPIDVNYTWDGNAYNVWGTQLYEYGPMDIPFNNGFALFDNTITVIQEHDTSMIDYFYFTETYARNIGMIHKQEFDITTLITDTNQLVPWPYVGRDWYMVPRTKRIRDGSVVVYKLIEYGFE